MRRDGFSLIELIVVMGIISILAGIIVPRYNSVQERAYVSAMQSDLHSLRYSQEIYLQPPDLEYASDVAQLEDYAPSNGVTVTITGAGPGFWSGEASHVGTSRICSYATNDGVILCGDVGPPVDDKGGDGGEGK